MVLSIVIAVMNEEENVVPLIDGIRSALDGLDYELVFVDDGSSDGTVRRIKEAADRRTHLIVFNRNFGQTTAMAAGIEAAQGDCIVTMDGDLQNDPGDIPMMVRILEEGEWDLVHGRRAKRSDGFILRRIPSRIANHLIRRITGVHVSDYGCTLKVFRREIAKNLGLYGELHRFIPVLAAMQGARLTEVDVRHHPRIHGSSKYGIGRTFRVLSDLVFMRFMQRYARKPMHFFGGLGFFTSGAGGAILVYLLALKLAGESIGGRPLLLLGVLLSVAGIQLVTTGFLAELLIRIYYETGNRKPYSVREIFVGKRGADPESAAKGRTIVKEEGRALSGKRGKGKVKN